jgi:hypothetical protein
VQVRDGAGREVDPVAAHEPVSFRPLGQLPYERAALDLRGTEECLVAGNVVDNVVARARLDTVGMVREPQSP